jgi:hypothetical protein
MSEGLAIRYIYLPCSYTRDDWLMPRKGRSNEEIIHALHQVEGGEKVAEVCRRVGVMSGGAWTS